MDKPKQIIVIRRDLKMRRGKEIAQGAHASMKFLVEEFNRIMYGDEPRLKECAHDWLNDKFTKITCQVDTEEELLNIYNKGKEMGLLSYLVTDYGLTEFNGVPTNTAVAIGPNLSSEIDKLTGPNGLFPLKLY